MNLSELKPAEGSKHSDNFRRGRGHGSGNGKTAGKGHKGQKARSGAPRPGFEGGQMPLYRRLPKRGFTNRNSKDIVAINVDVLNRFDDGAVVTVESLLETGIIKNPKDGVKILGNISFIYFFILCCKHSNPTALWVAQRKDGTKSLSVDGAF